MGTLAEEIGANIRIAREAAGLSQAALAQEIYVSRQTVNNWECGRTLPDVESLKMLSRRLETSVDALMGDDAQELLTSTADDRHTLAKLLAGSVFWYGAFFVVTLAVIVIQVWRIGLDASADRSLNDELALWGVCLNCLQLGLCFARASQQRKIRRFLDDQRLHDAVEVAAYLEGRHEGTRLPDDVLYRVVLPNWEACRLIGSVALVLMVALCVCVYVFFGR